MLPPSVIFLSLRVFFALTYFCAISHCQSVAVTRNVTILSGFIGLFLRLSASVKSVVTFTITSSEWCRGCTVSLVFLSSSNLCNFWCFVVVHFFTCRSFGFLSVCYVSSVWITSLNQNTLSVSIRREFI